MPIIVMVKIKIYTSSDERDLEEGVNHYLEQVGKSNLINIKYSTSIKEGKLYHSAMIIYEERKKEDAGQVEKAMYE
jgi:hypothetical protein